MENKDKIEEEIWKDVVGYEGLYAVSSLGRVKSLTHNIENKFGTIIMIQGKILKPMSSGNGYSIVSLYIKNNSKTRKIHQLVAESFLGHTSCGYKLVVDHIDNDPLNNRVENLQIVSHRYNITKNTSRGSSGYVGVSWDKSRNKWIAQIRINGKSKHIGRYDNELDAAEAYQNELNKLNE